MAMAISGLGLPQGQPGIGIGSSLPSLGGKAAGGASFGDALQNALGEVSEVQDNAQEIVAAYLRGDQVELHQVMAATEEAGIALEMLVEVRNKLTEAYRSVINMQS
jgi:flagellar hook-basal body complex protein FliE